MIVMFMMMMMREIKIVTSESREHVCATALRSIG